MKVKPPHRSISSSTRRPRQTKKKNKQTKFSLVAKEEYSIVDILSKDTPWSKKMIKFKVEETKFESRSRSTKTERTYGEDIKYYYPKKKKGPLEILLCFI